MLRVACLPGGRAAAIAALVLVIALLPVTGPGHAQDDPPAGAVSLVNGDPIAREAFQARVRFVRWQYLRELEQLYEWTGGNFGLTPGHVADRLADLGDPAGLADAVLRQLEQERLLWQTGEAMGITPTAEEAQAQEAAFFSRWTNVPVAELATDEVAQAFIADWYAGATAASGLTADDIRIIFETEALRAKLFEHLGESVPTEEPGAHTRHILCSFHPDNVGDITPPTPDQRAAAAACIQAAADRLDAGEAFEDVAADLSDDASTAAEGGDVGWQLFSYLAEPYAEAARTAELDTVTGPVETVYGYHLLTVLERGTLPLTPKQLDDSRRGYFQLWLATLWDKATVTRSADWDAEVPALPGLETLSAPVQAAIAQFQAGE